MENSPTGESTVAPASQEPTGQAPVDNTAELNQETNSGSNTQESVSDDTAQQTNTNIDEKGSGSTTDDGLAKFAKSQGVDDISQLSEREQRFLKIAHDNQKALRSNSGDKITDATKNLGGTDLAARVAQMEYAQTTDKFFSDGKDRSLEPEMVSILNEKVQQLTPQLGEAEAKKYVFNLSRDLDTLYGMAQLRAGKTGGSVDPEAIRREERESIKRQSTASAGQPHAVTQNTAPQKVTREWIAEHYQPSNPEHRKLVDEAIANGDL